MTTLAPLQTLIAQGKPETLELKRSTTELKRAGEALCAFLNGEGGKVLIGVAPDGKLVGQDKRVGSTTTVGRRRSTRAFSSIATTAGIAGRTSPPWACASKPSTERRSCARARRPATLT